MAELFTCQVCKYHLEDGGCIKPYTDPHPCPYGKPINQVPKTYFKTKIKQTTLQG